MASKPATLVDALDKLDTGDVLVRPGYSAARLACLLLRSADSAAASMVRHPRPDGHGDGEAPND